MQDSKDGEDGEGGEDGERHAQWKSYGRRRFGEFRNTWLFHIHSMLAHERLKAWELCHELVLRLYRASEHWPKEERYGITSQIRSAAVSTASNIAEGAAKHGPKEFRRYLNISLGSLAETYYLLRLARDLGILTPDAWRDLNDLQRRAGGLTWRLARSLTGGTK